MKADFSKIAVQIRLRRIQVHRLATSEPRQIWIQCSKRWGGKLQVYPDLFTPGRWCLARYDAEGVATGHSEHASFRFAVEESSWHGADYAAVTNA